MKGGSIIVDVGHCDVTADHLRPAIGSAHAERHLLVIVDASGHADDDALVDRRPLDLKIGVQQLDARAELDAGEHGA